MIKKFLTIIFWVAWTFALPAFLFIVGANFFLDGAGIKFHVDHNSLTYLGLMLIRAGLPVTPPSRPLSILPLQRLDADDPFMKELEKALADELARQQDADVKPHVHEGERPLESDKKDDKDGGSGPSTPGN